MLLAGCSGAPFSLAAQTQDVRRDLADASPQEAATSTILTLLDASPDNVFASPPEAGTGYHTPVDSSAPEPDAGDIVQARDSAPEPDTGFEMEPREAAPICSPAKTKLQDACALFGAARTIYQAAMLGQASPWYVWVVQSTADGPAFPPQGGCADLQVPGCSASCQVYDLQLAPPACQCAETFDCACLWSAPGLFQRYACEMVAGQPVVSRNTAGAPDGSLP